MNEITATVIVTLATVILLGALWWAIRLALRQYRERTDANRALLTALQRASESFSSASDSTAKAAAGILEVSANQSKSLLRLEEAIQIFRKSLFGRDEKGFIPFDEGAADTQYRIEYMMQQGIPREEAIARVEQERMWKSRAESDPISRMRLE